MRSCPLLRLRKGHRGSTAQTKQARGECTVLLPLSPPLFPAAAIIHRWASVVYVVMLKGCIFACEQVSTSR